MRKTRRVTVSNEMYAMIEAMRRRMVMSTGRPISTAAASREVIRFMVPRRTIRRKV